MKFTVYLRAAVPVFAQIDIEADTAADAQAKAIAMAGAEHDAITALKWEYGASVSNPIGVLDERDYHAIEAIDAMRAEAAA